VHLQSDADMAEADYLAFEKLEVLNTVKQDLYYFLQRVLKFVQAKMNEIFYFLMPTKDYIHSKKG
jgi:hypothetical protein